MQHSDFKVGVDFYTAIGLWRCTDIGQRTITAVRWPEDVEIPSGTRAQDWLKGPPYPLEEVVFDEKEMALAYRTMQEAVERSLQSAHPGFSGDDARKMMGSKQKRFERRLSGGATPAINPLMESLCRYERVVNGQVLHAYDWDEGGLVVHALDVYERTWEKVPLADFLAAPVAREEDYAARNTDPSEKAD